MGHDIKTGWSQFLSHLKQRGLQGVQLFVSDACLGLVESLGAFYSKARWQRCVVHFYRNIFSYVPRGKMREVAAMLKAIHAQEDREAAEEKAVAVKEKLRSWNRYAKVQILTHSVKISVSLRKQSTSLKN